MSVDDLLINISKGLKKRISKEEIFSNQIRLVHLKKIDRIFNKGLHFYLDPKSPEISKDASIFFRKEKFNSDLNLGARKVVNHFEEFKISLSAISKLTELNIDRRIPIYTTNDSPKEVADLMRNELYPKFDNNLKEFLKSLISSFAKKNILVFEFVETWNKKDKANIDGFFLSPNVIVLKRQQRSFRREIFTLIHELGHYLLNEEEIESLDYKNLAKKDLSKIEKWCNDFAYYFLIGNFINEINKLEISNIKNDYNIDVIDRISKKTHLSTIALFTKLLFEDKITQADYNKIKKDLEKEYNLKREEEKRLQELEKEMGRKQEGRSAKAIRSPLLISTIQTAFQEGVINEYEVCKRLNIKPEKIDKFIQ